MSTLMKKRKLSSSPSATGSVTRNEFQRLKRQVLANKPELQQESYTVTVPATGITPLLDPSLITGDEFKLHRVHVAYANSAGTNTGPFWGVMYSPKEGFTSTDIPNGAAGSAPQNYLEVFNSTKQRVWSRKTFNQFPTQFSGGAAAGGHSRFFEYDKSWPIPMKCGTDANVSDPTVLHNQIYMVGSQLLDLFVVTVTIWFTDS